jgi:hypothetical protein
MNLRFTLVADGPTDAALVPVLRWLIVKDERVTEFTFDFADPTKVRLPSAREGLVKRVKAALSLYPADVLFVHRDAERERHARRRREVLDTLEHDNIPALPVPVIPVRMTEAWLLFDEKAVRKASGNPSGTMPLNLPSLRSLESVPDPKETLHATLKTACGLRGRMLAKFDERRSHARLPELIDDFLPLRTLAAFQALEADLSSALDRLTQAP